MSIIAYKNNISNPVNFLDIVEKSTYINGMYIYIVQSKDGNIIAYSIDPKDNLSLEDLQNNTIEKLDKTCIIELDTLLNRLDTWTKKIVINVTPIIIPPLSESTIKLINQKNWEYISKIKDIVEKHKNLNISLHSTNRLLIDYMINQIKSFKIGWEIAPNDLTYITTDYYVLSSEMLNEEIILQQLNLGKEIMVKVVDGNDLMLVFEFFHKNSNANRDIIFNKTTFVCSYPEMFYELFKKNTRYY